MKVVVQEVEKEGLSAFLGKKIVVLCANYFYNGTLVGINDSCIKLENAGIVYETGSFTPSTLPWKDEQKLPGGVWYVQIGSIESFGAGK